MLVAPPAPTRPPLWDSAATVAVPAAMPQPLGPPGSVHSETEAAHAALRAALTEFGGTRLRTAHDSQAIDRWENDAGPVRSAHAGDGHIRRRERRAWEAHERAHSHLYQAVGAYARALRQDGVGLAAALVTVRATVGGAAGRCAPAVLAALQRDAARCCVEAFTAR